MKTIDPFYHPQPNTSAVSPQLFGDKTPPISSAVVPHGTSYGLLRSLKALDVGRGKYGFHVNRQGMSLGNEDFSQAPFSVDMQGQATFRDALGQTIVDASGIKSDTQFVSSEIEDFTDRTTALATPADLAFTTLQLTLQRATNIFIPITVTAYLAGLTGIDAGADPTGIVQLSVDGTTQAFQIEFQDMRMYSSDTTGLAISRTFTQSYTKLLQLGSGLHTIKLIFYLLTASSYVLHITQSSIKYITLGK